MAEGHADVLLGAKSTDQMKKRLHLVKPSHALKKFTQPAVSHVVTFLPGYDRGIIVLGTFSVSVL